MQQGPAHAEWVVEVLIRAGAESISEMVKLSTRSLGMMFSKVRGACREDNPHCAHP